MTRGEVAAAVRERAASTTVTIDSGAAAGTRTVHLSDLGYTVDVDATVDAVFSAYESWSSFATSLVSARDVDAVVKTEPARIAAVAAELVEQTDRAGRDAAVELAPDKKSFVAVAAVEGERVAPESFQDVVATSARDLASTTATVTFVDAEPTITTADAEQAARAANALVDRKVTRVRRRGPAQRVEEAQGVVGDDPEHRRHTGQPGPRRREGQGLGREGGDVREGRAARRRAQRRRRRRHPLRLHRGP